MKKLLPLIFTLLFLTTIIPLVKSDELDDVSTQLEKLKRELAESQRATQPLEADLQRLKKELDEIKTRLDFLAKEIAKKEKEVKIGEETLALQKKILDQRTFAYYKNVKKAEVSFLSLLTADNLSESLQNFFYQKTLADRDKQTIIKIVVYIKDLEEKKKNLESEKDRLAVLKADVDKQSQFLSGEVAKAKKYQAELSTKIVQLSARQQQLVAQKLASLNIPRSAETTLGGCVDDRDKDPGFSPRFAFFTFGVPNRTGLNQFGAYGRAKAGQNEEEILRAYYENFELKKDYNTGINITVEGYGTFNIEDYLKRIYEMPINWDANNLAALKAQAIAARSYALAYTGNGQGSICASQQCQVFRPEEKGGNWNAAVEATKGWVMMQGGNPIKAWYSSTHGGYILKSGELPGWSDTSWTKHASDTRESVGSLSDLRDSNKAYDKESPWFYCDWGSRPAYNKTAWLKQEEVADIANILMLVKRDASVGEHLYQIDKANPAGTDTWDGQKVKQELKNRGGNSFNTVSEVSVSADLGAAKTTNVTISGDAGSVSFDGKEFKDWFNLRAPANIQIVGPLYNIEKR